MIKQALPKYFVQDCLIIFFRIKTFYRSYAIGTFKKSSHFYVRDMLSTTYLLEVLIHITEV